METMTEEKFNAFAKRITDAIIGHDSYGNGYMHAGYSKPNGILLYRMAKGSHSRAVSMFKNIMKQQFVANPLDRLLEEEHDAFVEAVMSYAMGEGLEVEWDHE
jgi:hypothetical protein